MTIGRLALFGLVALLAEPAANPLVERVGNTGFLQIEAPSFAQLTDQQKALAYYLTEASIAIDPIVYDQLSRFGIREKRLLEGIVAHHDGIPPATFAKIREYALLFWANRGNHNETTAQKFLPGFTADELSAAALAAQRNGAFKTPYADLPALATGDAVKKELADLHAAIFDASFEPMTTAKTPPAGKDIVQASANTFYQGVSLADLKGFAERFPLNSRVVKDAKGIREEVYRAGTPDGTIAPGLYALWTSEHDVRVETVDASTMRLDHPELPAILKTPGTATLLEVVNIEPGHAGVWYRDGAYQATLAPGTYAFWKNVGTLKVYDVDLKEQVLDISGQEIMTADKVTLRLNALVAYRIADPLRSVTVVDGAAQALYRAAQLALREAVGAKDLDTLLAGKDALAAEVAQALEPRATELGMTVVTAGVRDLILPGDMKDLMNKVTEAKKAAEASLITRREETAAMRMQANTAKILESNPTLMKLKELEVLEKVADKAHLTVLLGEDGLTSKVMKLV